MPYNPRDPFGFGNWTPFGLSANQGQLYAPLQPMQPQQFQPQPPQQPQSGVFGQTLGALGDAYNYAAESAPGQAMGAVLGGIGNAVSAPARGLGMLATTLGEAAAGAPDSESHIKETNPDAGWLQDITAPTTQAPDLGQLSMEGLGLNTGATSKLLWGGEGGLERDTSDPRLAQQVKAVARPLVHLGAQFATDPALALMGAAGSYGKLGAAATDIEKGLAAPEALAWKYAEMGPASVETLKQYSGLAGATEKVIGASFAPSMIQGAVHGAGETYRQAQEHGWTSPEALEAGTGAAIEGVMGATTAWHGLPEAAQTRMSEWWGRPGAEPSAGDAQKAATGVGTPDDGVVEGQFQAPPPSTTAPSIKVGLGAGDELIAQPQTGTGPRPLQPGDAKYPKWASEGAQSEIVAPNEPVAGMGLPAMAPIKATRSTSTPYSPGPWQSVVEPSPIDRAISKAPEPAPGAVEATAPKPTQAPVPPIAQAVEAAEAPPPKPVHPVVAALSALPDSKKPRSAGEWMGEIRKSSGNPKLEFDNPELRSNASADRKRKYTKTDLLALLNGETDKLPHPRGERVYETEDYSEAQLQPEERAALDAQADQLMHEAYAASKGKLQRGHEANTRLGPDGEPVDAFGNAIGKGEAVDAEGRVIGEGEAKNTKFTTKKTGLLKELHESGEVTATPKKIAEALDKDGGNVLELQIRGALQKRQSAEYQDWLLEKDRQAQQGARDSVVTDEGRGDASFNPDDFQEAKRKKLDWFGEEISTDPDRRVEPEKAAYGDTNSEHPDSPFGLRESEEDAAVQLINSPDVSPGDPITNAIPKSSVTAVEALAKKHGVETPKLTVLGNGYYNIAVDLGKSTDTGQDLIARISKLTLPNRRAQAHTTIDDPSLALPILETIHTKDGHRVDISPKAEMIPRDEFGQPEFATEAKDLAWSRDMNNLGSRLQQAGHRLSDLHRGNVGYVTDELGNRRMVVTDPGAVLPKSEVDRIKSETRDQPATTQKLLRDRQALQVSRAPRGEDAVNHEAYKKAEKAAIPIEGAREGLTVANPIPALEYAAQDLAQTTTKLANTLDSVIKDLSQWITKFVPNAKVSKSSGLTLDPGLLGIRTNSSGAVRVNPVALWLAANVRPERRARVLASHILHIAIHEASHAAYAGHGPEHLEARKAILKKLIQSEQFGKMRDALTKSLEGEALDAIGKLANNDEFLSQWNKELARRRNAARQDPANPHDIRTVKPSRGAGDASSSGVPTPGDRQRRLDSGDGGTEPGSGRGAGLGEDVSGGVRDKTSELGASAIDRRSGANAGLKFDETGQAILPGSKLAKPTNRPETNFSDSPLFTQERDARLREEAKKQRSLFDEAKTSTTYKPGEAAVKTVLDSEAAAKPATGKLGKEWLGFLKNRLTTEQLKTGGLTDYLTEHWQDRLTSEQLHESMKPKELVLSEHTGADTDADPDAWFGKKNRREIRLIDPSSDFVGKHWQDTPGVLSTAMLSDSQDGSTMIVEQLQTDRMRPEFAGKDKPLSKRWVEQAVEKLVEYAKQKGYEKIAIGWATPESGDPWRTGLKGWEHAETTDANVNKFYRDKVAPAFGRHGELSQEQVQIGRGSQRMAVVDLAPENAYSEARANPPETGYARQKGKEKRSREESLELLRTTRDSKIEAEVRSALKSEGMTDYQINKALNAKIRPIKEHSLADAAEMAKASAAYTGEAPTSGKESHPPNVLINPEHLGNLTEDVKTDLVKTLKANKGKLDQRLPESWDQVEAQAQEMFRSLGIDGGRKYDAWLKRGGAFTSAAGVSVARSRLETHAQRVWDLRQEVLEARAKGNPNKIQNAEQKALLAHLEQANFLSAFADAQASAGRILNAFQIVKRSRLPIDEILDKIYRETCI